MVLPAQQPACPDSHPAWGHLPGCAGDDLQGKPALGQLGQHCSLVSQCLGCSALGHQLCQVKNTNCTPVLRPGVQQNIPCRRDRQQAQVCLPHSGCCAQAWKCLHRLAVPVLLPFTEPAILCPSSGTELSVGPPCHSLSAPRCGGAVTLVPPALHPSHKPLPPLPGR